MNYTFSTDDKEEAEHLMRSGEAWDCLRRVRQSIRNHKKHDTELDIDLLYENICETLDWVE